MSEANVAVVRRAWDAWLSGDLPGLFAHFDPDVVWDTSHFRDWPEAAYHGIEGVERFLTEWLDVWADYEMDVDDVIATPDGRVVSLLRQRGRGRDSGLPMEMSLAQIATLRDGKVARLDNYEDQGEALRDAGLPRAMSEENVEILRRLYEQWATGDLSSTDFFDPNAEYSRIGSETPGMEGRWLGFDEMATAMREYLRPLSDLRIEAERIIDLGEGRVLVLSRHTARGKQSGVPIEHENGDLFTLRDGKIVRYEAYWDRAEALEAAGLRK